MVTTAGSGDPAPPNPCEIMRYLEAKRLAERAAGQKAAEVPPENKAMTGPPEDKAEETPKPKRRRKRK